MDLATNNSVMSCDGTHLLEGIGLKGGSSIQGSINRFFSNLQSHQSIFITLEVWLIDQWMMPTDYLQLYIYDNNQQPNLLSTHISKVVQVVSSTYWPDSNLCGSTSYPNLSGSLIFAQASQIGSSVTIEVSPFNSDSGYSGIRNLRILVSNKTGISASACSVASNSSLLSTTGCGCAYNQYYNSGTCLTCDPSCKYCYGVGSSNCYACSDDYIYDGTDCIK